MPVSIRVPICLRVADCRRSSRDCGPAARGPVGAIRVTNCLHVGTQWPTRSPSRSERLGPAAGPAPAQRSSGLFKFTGDMHAPAGPAGYVRTHRPRTTLAGRQRRGSRRRFRVRRRCHRAATAGPRQFRHLELDWPGWPGLGARRGARPAPKRPREIPGRGPDLTGMATASPSRSHPRRSPPIRPADRRGASPARYAPA